MARYDSTLNRYVGFDSAVPEVLTKRVRVTVAQLNAGLTVLAAIPGLKYRIVDYKLVAVGGNATTATSVNVRGTRAAGVVELLVVAIAALTRSAVVRAGAANAVVLADGASFTVLDVNTAVTIITVGTAMTVLTDLDVELQYVLEE